jgi:8-oxo-dGTP diphosphatase
MPLYLVRHAKAGSRERWEGDDTLRPLSKAGRQQSLALAERLAAVSPTLLVSSPYVRCSQTLEPLAQRCGLTVSHDLRVAEGRPFTEALALLEELPDRAVVCSHGDVIPDVVAALERRGTAITTPPDWRKASVWVLERRGDAITSAAVWPPPAV